MSEVKRYECTVLIDASCGVTVEASSPEEAAELAENAAAEQGAGSLCHQCSSHTECGDSYAVIVYDEAGDEVLDTDYRSGQLKAVQSELTALREELAGLEKWRELALQFDHHRMVALGYLKALVNDQGYTDKAAAFLANPPLAAHEVVASLTAAEERNAELEKLLGTAKHYITDLASSLGNACEFFEGDEDDDPQADRECSEAMDFAERIDAALTKPTESGASE